MTLTVRITTGPVGKLRREVTMSLPCAGVTFDILRAVSDQLGVSVCYYLRGWFHFELARPGLTLAVKPDSAGRYCVAVCEYAARRDIKWVSSTDRARLARIVAEATEVMMDDARYRAPDPA